MVDVEFTATSQRQIDGLHGDAAISFWRWFGELQMSGCSVAGYRLTGDVPQRMCSRHLYERWRVVTLWRSPSQAVVVGVGRHDRGPADVYDSIFRAVGVDGASIAGRDKPSCCGEDGVPPIADDELIDSLSRRVRARRG